MRFYLVLWAFLLFFSFLLFSCKKSSSVSESWEGESIRLRMNKLVEYAEWTEELEPKRISVPLHEDVKKSSLAAVASATFCLKPVFPYVEGFGSLDTTELPFDLRKKIESFCCCLFDEQGGDSFMAKQSLFSLAFFYADVTKRISKSTDLNKKISVKNILIGEPFFKNDEYEVPVRIDFEKKQLDLRLFAALQEGSWFFTQILLDDWREK